MTLEAAGKADFKVIGDVYRFEWGTGIEAELERFSEHRDDLSAEVTFHSTRQPHPGMLHSARLNLMSTQTRTSLVKTLSLREPDLDWGGMVEAMCFRAREQYRGGDPSIDMREYQRTVSSRWLVEPFVELGGPTILFADGGTGKSLTALSIAVTASCTASVIGRLHGEPVPVLFLDYETDADTFDERLAALVRGAGARERPPIFYRRMTASLPEAAATIRREITKLGVGFVVVDSLGAARAGEPESADMTIRLFNAGRSLGVPWLGVDHVTKASGNDSTRPFGSTYTHNLARLTWGADKAQEEGENTIVLALRNHKRNNGRFLPRTGFRIDFQNTDIDELLTVQFRSTDLTDVPGLAEKMPLRTRILAALRDGPVLRATLSESLSNPSTLRSRLKELRDQGQIIELPDGYVALRAHSA
jgi:hypothetical protein